MMTVALVAALFPVSAGIERLGWVLVYSLWQFAAVALVVAIALRLLSPAAAQARYLVGCCGLVAMLAWSAFTWTTLTLPTNEPSTAKAATTQSDALVAPTSSDPFGTATATNEGQLTSITPAASSRTWLSFTAMAREWQDAMLSQLRPWLPTLVGLWAVGGLLFVVRLAMGWRAARRLATTDIVAPPAAMRAAMSRVSARLNLKQPVQLWQSTHAEVPLVTGCLRPVVLLPASLVSGLTPDQLESLLAHELAHVRRHDFLVNLLQSLVETLFFYHPAIWWLSARIRIERENCCDDMALEICPNRLGYARALVALEELRSAGAGLALGADGGSLLDRVRRIAGVRSEPQPSAVAVLAASLIVVSAIASGVWAGPEAVVVRNRPAAFSVASKQPAPTKQPAEVVQVAFADEEKPTTLSTAEAVPAGWFRPDPYSHLGLVENAGAGWHYVRLVSDLNAGRQIHTTPAQRDAAYAIYQAFMEKDRGLEAELRKQGSLTIPDWPQARAAQWMEARAATRALLNDEQHQRVEQLMVQRLSYHVFRDVRDGSGANSGMRGKALAETIGLNKQQTARIEAAIDAHHKRIRDNQKNLDLAIEDRPADAGGEVEAARVRDLTRHKVQLGIQSHRQVWDDVYRILTPDQRRKFDELRGPAVEAEQP